MSHPTQTTTADAASGGEGTAGASLAGSSSRPSDQAPAGLDLSGFDLSRGPFADFARDLEWRATKVEHEAWDSRDNLARCHGRADGLREAAGLARVRDRSGEAGETPGSPEGKSPAPSGATPHPQAPIPSVSEVEAAQDGMAAQVADQCRVVAHLATTLARVHSDYAKLASAPAFAEILPQIGERSARFMEELGEALNSMDASSPDDAWTGPVFEKAHRLFPDVSTLQASHAQDGEVRR